MPKFLFKKIAEKDRRKLYLCSLRLNISISPLDYGFTKMRISAFYTLPIFSYLPIFQIEGKTPSLQSGVLEEDLAKSI
jgi:hypothetical protein